MVENLIGIWVMKKKMHQTADCFIEDLTAQCFSDTSNFPWIKSLESNDQAIFKNLNVEIFLLSEAW